MSSTQERRREYNYREEYFKHNKGLFGIYFCAQCFKPLLKKDVEVDHIIPLGKKGINHVSNCTATCRKCNRSKSDKLDERAIKGFVFKGVEELFILSSRCLKTIILNTIKYGLKPIKNTNGILNKLMLIILYILLITAIINL